MDRAFTPPTPPTPLAGGPTTTPLRSTPDKTFVTGMCDLTTCDENRSGERVSSTDTQQPNTANEADLGDKQEQTREGVHAPENTLCDLTTCDENRSGERVSSTEKQQPKTANEADFGEKQEQKREGVHAPEKTLSRDKSFIKIQFSQILPSPLSRFLSSARLIEDRASRRSNGHPDYSSNSVSLEVVIRLLRRILDKTQ